MIRDKLSSRHGYFNCSKGYFTSINSDKTLILTQLIRYYIIQSNILFELWLTHYILNKRGFLSTPLLLVKHACMHGPNLIIITIQDTIEINFFLFTFRNKCWQRLFQVNWFTIILIKVFITNGLLGSWNYHLWCFMFFCDMVGL